MSIILHIDKKNIIYDHEIKITAIRAQGPGGQHVNKTSTAILLQFDSASSSLAKETKQGVLNCNDYRINKDGLISIKAQRYRSQEQNKIDAIERLQMILKKATQKKKKRIPTKPSKSSIKKRITTKNNRAKVKKTRNKPTLED